MTDVHDPITRSRNMSAITCRNTHPEIILRKALHKAGFRYSLKNQKFLGRPDIIFPKYKAVIFVHGCFWHHHQCHFFQWPKTNPEFWKEKIKKNENRDQLNQKNLLTSGWRVGVIWECSLKGKTSISIDILIGLITSWLESNKNKIEIGRPFT